MALAVVTALVAMTAMVAGAPPSQAADRATVHLQEVENPDGIDLSGVSYTLTYTWPAGDGFDAGSGSEAITHSRPVNVDVPDGAVLTFDLVMSDVENGTWGVTRYSPSQTVSLDGARPPRVDITPSITRSVGSFSIAKTLSGTGSGLVPTDTEFRVSWSYEAFDGLPGQSGELTVRAGSAPVVVDDIPAGAEISLSEAAPDPITGGTWLDPVFSQQTFTVVADQQTAVDLDNHITLTTGSVSITATVDGDGVSLLSADAVFDVAWSHPAGSGFEADSGTIEVPASGEAVALTDLPYGAEVTLGPVSPPTVDGATWQDVALSEQVVTIGDGTTAVVALTGTITEDEAVAPTDEPTSEPTADPSDSPAPSESPTPSESGPSQSSPSQSSSPSQAKDPQLADTGAPDVAATVVAALALVSAGGLLLGSRRRGARSVRSPRER